MSKTCTSFCYLVGISIEEIAFPGCTQQVEPAAMVAVGDDVGGGLQLGMLLLSGLVMQGVFNKVLNYNWRKQ